MKLKSIFKYLCFYILLYSINTDDSLLKGTMISSEENSSLIKYAFDNRLSTQFKSEYESNGWVGMDLRNPYIITKIEWGTNETDHSTYLLGVFECGNTKNFEDALPLYMITTPGKINAMNSVEIVVQKSFQYIRYVGPNGKYCKINNIRIFGYYSFVDGDYINYYKPSNLPLLIIHSINGEEPTNKELSSCFYLINDNTIQIAAFGNFKLKGIPDLNKYKKSYYISFDAMQKPLDFNSYSKIWSLVSNYGDKTLIRNLLSLEISKIFEMEYTIKCVPIDLMINGEYKGTYNLCEYIEISENKINIAKMNENDILEPEITGGYLLEIDGFAYLGSLNINSRKGVPISIRSPNEEDKIMEEQINYIKDKYNEFEFEIYNNNLNNIDLKSFVKYFLIEELIGNPQSYWNTYIYKNRNDSVFYFGPISDSEMAYDNDIRVYPVNCKDKYIFNFGLSAGTMDKFINKIIQNKTVVDKIKEEWEYIYNNKLNLDNLYNFINETMILIKESKDLNFIRWDIMDKQISFNPRIYSSYDEEINTLKNFIKNRIGWLNNYILNITNKNEFFCDISQIPENEEKEIDYDINDTEEIDDGLNYKLLSTSYIFSDISFFYFICFISFIYA